MKSRELIKLGYPKGPILTTALSCAGEARMAGRSKEAVRTILRQMLVDATPFETDPQFGRLAGAVREAGLSIAAKRKPSAKKTHNYRLNDDLDYAVWGDDIDPQAHEQMRNACRLPISVAAALMPDAHLGYGLPIGGVLGTRNAVIPYAVGVDIACRMMMTVFDLPSDVVKSQYDRFAKILENNTQFGVGAKWRKRQEHPVMDEDWHVTPVTARLKDQAYSQLGTSGSGNHFVEFGEIELSEDAFGVPAGTYLAVMSHSGSRGPGNRVASHYSKVAMNKHSDLPKELRHLAWLDMEEDGAEYWAAMELMGRFASANHHVIHKLISRAVGASVLGQLENHHNFAWKEEHHGETLIVHRKGATPAGKGVLGIIPGSMASPAYVVEGQGDPTSLNSASHGAGRVMSRRQATHTFRWADVRQHLVERGVSVISAGLDEVPFVYKNIDEVMAAQRSLVRPLARFFPRIVKMAPAGEKPED
jgi:tRNA-splicing ligase RtcB